MIESTSKTSYKDQYIKLLNELHFKSVETQKNIEVIIKSHSIKLYYYYIRLRQSVTKIKQKIANQEPLKKSEQKKYQEYLDIRNEINKYSKRTQLINTIHHIKRVPKTKSNNHGVSEYTFDDGTDQGLYYNNLRVTVSKIKKKQEKKIPLTLYEIERIEDYEEIKKVIDIYSKKRQLISSINELHRLPKPKRYNNEAPERTFTDGTDQGTYFTNIKNDIKLINKKIQNNKPLTLYEQELLEEYQEIIKVLKKESRAQQLIDTINKLHRLPIDSVDNKEDTTFIDGTSKLTYYKNLRRAIKKINHKLENNIPLNNNDKIILKDYEEIEKNLDKYNRKKQLIKTIEELHRPPSQKKFGDGTYERTFYDGTNQYVYYAKLRTNANTVHTKLEQNIPLTPKEIELFKDYQDIEKTLNKYSRKTQLINSIIELKRLPRTKQNNNGIPEKAFEDGLCQGTYYYTLRRNVRNMKNREDSKKTLKSKEMEQDLQEINNILSYFPTRADDNIEMIKKICETNNIDILINSKLLSKSFYEIYIKLNYLIENNIPIINNKGKVHNIFFMSDNNMLLEYEVSIDDLVKKYIVSTHDSLGNNQVLKKI